MMSREEWAAFQLFLRETVNEVKPSARRVDERQWHRLEAEVAALEAMFTRMAA